MEKNKSSLYSVVAGALFALLGLFTLANQIRYNTFTLIVILDIAAYAAIAFALFTKRRDVILPISFSILAILSLFGVRFGGYATIMSLLSFIADGIFAFLCLGECTNLLEGFYKDSFKKVCFVPALVLFFSEIVPCIYFGGIPAKQTLLTLIISVAAYILAGMWIVNYEKAPKKVYNTISANTDTGVDIDTKNLINSIYECYCENVKKGLKAPATAVFCKPEELQIKELDGTYVVTGWVDSQNSYGAMIRTHSTLKLQNQNGKLVSVTNINLLGAGTFVGNYLTYTIFGIIMTAILFAISYFFVNSML